MSTSRPSDRPVSAPSDPTLASPSGEAAPDAVRTVPRAVLRGLVITLAVTMAGLALAWVFDLRTPPFVVLLGLVVGSSYGLLSVGLVLVYRVSGVVNFAQAQIGLFGAGLMPVLVGVGHLPFWIAFPFAALTGAATSALINATVVRRLSRAPRVMVVVATLGVAALLGQGADSLISFADSNSSSAAMPTPTGVPSFHLGPLLITPAFTTLMILGPTLVAALSFFLVRSRYGIAMRAVAANPDAARLTGISPVRMSALAWALAGLLSTVTAVLLDPASGNAGGDQATSVFGSGLLLRILAGAVVAGLYSLPTALVSGVLLGVVEQVLLWNNPDSSATDTLILVVLLISLSTRRRLTGRQERRSAWASVAGWPRLPERLATLWSVRHLGTALAVAVLGTAIWAGATDISRAYALTGLAASTFVVLSGAILVSLSGELALGQFAVAGVGGAAAWLVVDRTGNVGLGLLAATLAGAVCSTVLALPALRSRGMMLAATSLAFAVVLPHSVLTQSWLFGSEGVPIGQPVLGSYPLSLGTPYLLWTLALLIPCLLLTRNLWHGGFGRLLLATRDNEDAARAFTVPTLRVRLAAFVVAGALAGFGGAVYAQSMNQVADQSFGTDLSVTIVLALVVGGLSNLGGALIGTVWVIGLPMLFPGGEFTDATSYAGVLVILLYAPGGLVSLLRPLRDRLAVRLGRLHGVDIALEEVRGAVQPVDQDTAPPASTYSSLPVPSRPVAGAADRRPGETLLRADGLAKSYGGITAVDGAELEIAEGEIVGIIGPNGAGKTTTFEMLAGFTAPDSGTVHYLGHDITHSSPQHRARQGLVRSFQDAALFPTLTVTETVAIALERSRPTRLGRSLLGLEPGARAKRQDAESLIDYFGLSAYRPRRISELSTGTRRIVELACLVALQPRLLLLDEPTSGLAQRETEALAQLLRRLHADLAITMVVIEHDIPMIMSLANRVIAMADGRVLCSGTPQEVRADPRVADAYLGGDLAAIERSTHPALAFPS